MSQCLVCNTEYVSEKEVCPTCGWNLKLSSLVNTTIYLEVEAWARKMWHQTKRQQQAQQLVPEEISPIQDDLNELFNLLAEKPEEIESHLNLLTEKSQINILYYRDVIPSKNKVLEIPGNAKNPQNPSQAKPENIHLSLTEAQLVVVYNQNSQKLLKKVIEVSITEKTAIFEISRRGNYWIITLGNINYLVPKNNLRINQFNYNYLERIFNCYNYKPGESSKFLLLKPAIVSPLSGNKNWKIRETGVVQFKSFEEQTLEPPLPKNYVEKPLTDKERKLVIKYTLLIEYINAQDKLSKTAIEVNVTPGTIDALRLGSQEVLFEKVPRGNYWIINREEYQYLVPSNRIKINQFNLDTMAALFEFQGYQNENYKDFQLVKPATVSQLPEDETWKLIDKGILQFYPHSDSSEKHNLVKIYNENSDLLLSKVIDVNITEESLQNQRLGSSQYAILEKISAGRFWILKLKWGNFDLLVPRKNLRINQFNIINIKALFECQDYQASSKQFHLIKTAKVTPISEDKWQLKEMGILQFD